MNEAETRAELIDPALKAAGWGVVADSRIRREMICPGRIEGAGRRGKRRDRRLRADLPQPQAGGDRGQGARTRADTEGVGQAKDYAEKLQARFAYSTNGRRIYQIDMETGAEDYVERYPTPDELWAKVFATAERMARPLRRRAVRGARAAPGRRATTSTTPSRTRWKPSPPASSASC